MKLYEVLPETQLDENAWRKALAAGIVGTSMLSPVTTSKAPPPEPQEVSQERPRDEMVVHGKRSDLPKFEVEPQIEPPGVALRRTELAIGIAKHYRVNQNLAQKVVNLAFEYEDSEFPKAEDILAVIGIESSFNPDSVSPLRKDPARGLMQVRPGIWNLDPESLDSIESQIKYGVGILKHYYRKTGSQEDTLHAYNIGLTRFRRGGRNERYVAKVQQEVGRYD